MFGYIKPQIGELKVKEHTAYRAVYCGLCKATGGGGCSRAVFTPAKLALRYDTVFLALLRMMLSPEPTGIQSRRCLLHPFKPRPMADASEAITYSADAGSLLLAHSLRDHAQDSRGLRGLAAKLLLPYASALRRAASEAVGEALDAAISEHLAALSRLERENEPSPDRTSHLFGLLLGDVFAHSLPEPAAAHAGEIGYRLGKWIYLADAVDDLPADRKTGSYNPFLSSTPDPDLLENAMLLELRSADGALSRMEGGDAGCRAILENILRLGLPAQTEHLVNKLRKDLP